MTNDAGMGEWGGGVMDGTEGARAGVDWGRQPRLGERFVRRARREWFAKQTLRCMGPPFRVKLGRFGPEVRGANRVLVPQDVSTFGGGICSGKANIFIRFLLWHQRRGILAGYVFSGLTGTHHVGGFVMNPPDPSGTDAGN
jgi:hypothetical protein